MEWHLFYLFESTLFNKHAMQSHMEIFFIFNKTSVWEVFIGVTHLIIMGSIHCYWNIRGESRIYAARVNFYLLENKPKATCSCSTVQVKLISSDVPAFWQQKTWTSILFGGTTQQTKVDLREGKKKEDAFGSHLGAQWDRVEGLVDLIDMSVLFEKQRFSRTWRSLCNPKFC